MCRWRLSFAEMFMISPVVPSPLRGRSERRAKRLPQAAVRPDGAAERVVAITGHTGHARDALIREAAYFRAERRGFAPGQELEDWFEAEREVDGCLSSG